MPITITKERVSDDAFIADFLVLPMKSSKPHRIASFVVGLGFPVFNHAADAQRGEAASFLELGFS